MTRDEIIRMAREAGSIDSEDVIETVWTAFAAAEREACAKVCEEQITGGDYHYLATRGHWDHMAQSATNCAAAIRARGEK